MRKMNLFKGVLVLCICTIAFLSGSTVSQAKVNVSVDYLEEDLIASTSGSAIYVSTDKEKTWDRLENTFTSGSSLCARFDISTVLANKEVTVYFRSNLLDSSDTFKLDGLSAIKGKFGMGVSGAAIAITGVPDGRVVEYRKGNASCWKTMDKTNKKVAVSGSTASLLVDEYTLKGATFTFRLKATTTQRVGKEIKVKVTKKANAPNVKVDGSKLMLTGLAAGKAEYRIRFGDEYVKVNDKQLPQVSIFGVTRSSVTTSSAGVTASKSGITISQPGITAPLLGGTFEIRTAKTDKKPASRSRNVIVMPQPELTDFSKIKVEAVKPKKVTIAAITISDASKTKAYEYTLLNASATTVELANVKWVAVNKTGQIQLKKTNGVDPSGALLIVRIKSTTDKTTKVVTPASTCYLTIVPKID